MSKIIAGFVWPLFLSQSSRRLVRKKIADKWNDIKRPVHALLFISNNLYPANCDQKTLWPAIWSFEIIFYSFEILRNCLITIYFFTQTLYFLLCLLHFQNGRYTAKRSALRKMSIVFFIFLRWNTHTISGLIEAVLSGSEDSSVSYESHWPILFCSLRKHMRYDRTPRLHQLLGDYLALTSDYQEALDHYTQALR